MVSGTETETSATGPGPLRPLPTACLRLLGSAASPAISERPKSCNLEGGGILRPYAPGLIAAACLLLLPLAALAQSSSRDDEKAAHTTETMARKMTADIAETRTETMTIGETI